MTAADLRLNRDQENVLRAFEETGELWPRIPEDRQIATQLWRRGLVRTIGLAGFELTCGGRDWLATHPTEVAR